MTRCWTRPFLFSEDGCQNPEVTWKVLKPSVSKESSQPVFNNWSDRTGPDTSTLTSAQVSEKAELEKGAGISVSLGKEQSCWRDYSSLGQGKGYFLFKPRESWGCVWGLLVSYLLAGHLLWQQYCCLHCVYLCPKRKKHWREKAGLKTRMLMGQGCSHSLAWQEVWISHGLKGHWGR